MNKKAYFFIDDVIWVFRDLTRKRPKSLFDNPFMSVLKTAHERYGMKVQLNTFMRTDFFYGADEFCLSEMTDAYKKEWEESADWLKLGFHSKQEFPDYPWINSDYDDVKIIFEQIKGEIERFAGKKTFALGAIAHWIPVSLDGVRALHDGGIKILGASYGKRTPYNGNPDSLPYGHAARLLQNRKPETELYTRVSLDEAIADSLCGYNHLPDSEMKNRHTLTAYLDKETGMYFKDYETGPILNHSKKNELYEEFKPSLDYEFIGYLTHEQYFYRDYFAYQPDYAEKIYLAAELLTKNGFEYIFIEELV